MSYRVDLSLIDREQFSVQERGGRYLITPSKSKHAWTEDELHLRSLLVDLEGRVLSSGWNKFFNYGENAQHDEEFRKALSRGAVEFVEKMDGSLIILDFIDGKIHLRTRGNFDLGTFEVPVLHLIANKYPQLIKWYLSDIFSPRTIRDRYSLLFEYVGPENRIVIRYEEPELYLLGAVNKNSLLPVWDRAWMESIAAQMGVPTPAVHLLPTNFDDLAPIVRAWQDKEGVVARFVGTLDGGVTNRPRMLKSKATQYLKLHGIKFRLEGKVAKLAFLLGVTNYENAKQKFEEMGVDFEGQQFLMPELDAYLEKHHEITRQYDYFAKITDLGARNPIGSVTGPVEPGSKEHRKTFVQITRAWIDVKGYPESFFNAAMKIYDGKMDEARIAALSQPLMGESPITVKNWLKNPQVALDEMFSVPVQED